jgi:hypothetical protein
MNALRWARPRSSLAARLAVITLGVAGFESGACLFLPAVDDDGYTACINDDDCDAGRACAVEVGLCAPPPWHDTSFTERRLIVVENVDDAELAAGTAIPIRIGGESATIALDDVKADARFTSFDEATGQWRVAGVYRDLFADRFTVWAPLPAAIGAGRREALVWLEQGTEAGTPTVLEEPATTFLLFDDLDDFPVDDTSTDRYFIAAPGAAAPVPGDGQVTIGDNVTVIWRQALTLPIELTFRARVNGLSCEEVFVGLTGNDAVGFNPPSAGFFLGPDLGTVGEVYATADAAVATELSPPRVFSEVPTALHRFTVQADGATVRLLIDDVVFDESADLRPTFDNAVPMFATVQVGGACSIDVDAMWATPLPAALPLLTVQEPIRLNITF